MATETNTYNGTNPVSEVTTHAGTNPETEAQSRTFNPMMSLTGEAGETGYVIPSTTHDPLVTTFNGKVTEIYVKGADGRDARADFSQNNSFAQADSLDIAAVDGVGQGEFAHDVTISLKKNGAAFLSVVLSTDNWAEDYKVEFKAIPV